MQLLSSLYVTISAAVLVAGVALPNAAAPASLQTRQNNGGQFKQRSCQGSQGACDFFNKGQCILFTGKSVPDAACK